MSHFAFDVGQSEIAAGEVVGEPFVVEPHQVQYGCVQIMQVNFVARGKVTKFVRGPITLATLDAAAGKEHGVTDVVVISSVGSLCDWRAAKLAAPDQQCIIEHTALFQIHDQGGDWLVDFHGVLAMIVGDVAVSIPFIAVRHLQESHTGLGKPAGHQALGAEVLCFGVVQAIH